MLLAGISGGEVITRAYRRYNLSLGGGLSKVAGKLFRIAHLGDMNEVHLMAAINGAEMAMLDCGVALQPGSGSAAAGNYWRHHAAPSGLGAPVNPKDQHTKKVFMDRHSPRAELRTPAFNRMAHTFSHIFTAGYAAVYYSYKWAEVLSANAYASFEETAAADGTPMVETGRLYR